MKNLVRIVIGLAVAGMTAWSAGAIYYWPIPGSGLRTALAIVFVIAVILAFSFLPRRKQTVIGFVGVFAVLVVLWRQIPASNDRQWQRDVAVTPYVDMNGNMVTIHGLRNFDYRTETDFVERWETRTYDLNELDSLDLMAVYWGSKAIAHIMLSFGFAGKEFLAVSIETRKEQGEEYSTFAGFFRNYELVYVVADERDVIRVRTTYRQPTEDVYLYRLRGPHENIRRLFLEYLKSINGLSLHPTFYNTLTTNCTTNILIHSRVNPTSPPLSWKILLSGYVPEYLYELGRLDSTRPFAELKRLAYVNVRARAADKDPAFSQRIRQGVPWP